MSNEQILQPETPAKFQSRNMRPKFRRLKAGDIFLIEHEVTEEVWNQLRTIPEASIIENVIWFHDGDGKDVPVSEPETKEAEPSGPYRFYWERLFKKGFNTYPDLCAVLNCDAAGVHDALHEFFEVESLSLVSARQFETFVADHNLNQGLITLSRNAEIAASEREQMAQSQN